MKKAQKIPTRLCVGCKNAYPKKELLRIVKNASGEIFFDPTGKKEGRGAYICKNKECFQLALKNQGFKRAFQSNFDPSLLKDVETEIFLTSEDA